MEFESSRVWVCSKSIELLTGIVEVLFHTEDEIRNRVHVFQIRGLLLGPCVLILVQMTEEFRRVDERLKR